MSTNYRICIDRILPAELVSSGRMLMGGASRAAIEKRKKWPNGSRLTIGFIGGTIEQRRQVQTWAEQWTNHANLTFDFSNDPGAVIRVGFVQDGRSWSAVGTDALNKKYFPPGDPTMNFGWPLEESTVLHEFGHALGLVHEHQNPQGGLQWNETAVLQYYAGHPNYWSEEVTRFNVLDKYDFDQINGTAFDPDSIMLYFYPPALTLNGVGTKANKQLSETDKQFIGSVVCYPRSGLTQDELAIRISAGEASATRVPIKGPDEEDLFLFDVREAGNYAVEVEGTRELYMRLFGPDNRLNLIGEDDGNGHAEDVRLAGQLPSGEYLLQVRHTEWAQGVGEYSISVVKV